jgi:hypothetical protein
MSEWSGSIPELLFTYVQPAKPTGAVEGETWYDTDDDRALVFVDDAGTITDLTVSDHSQLGGVGASDHHERFTASEAVDAVDGSSLSSLNIDGASIDGTGISPVPAPTWWSLSAPASQTRSSFKGDRVESAIHIVGGEDSGGTLSLHEAFDVDSGEWQTLSPMPTAREWAPVSYLDGYLYVCGGYDGSSYLTVVERYDVSTGNWGTVANLPSTYTGIEAVSDGTYLYVVGDEALLQYDPAANNWSTLPSPSARHTQLGSVYHNGYVYAIGGRDNSANEIDVVERFDISTGSWETIASLPEARSQFGATVYNGSIFAIGGGSQVDVYDISSNSWTRYPDVPSSTARLPVVSIDNSIWQVVTPEINLYGRPIRGL